LWGLINSAGTANPTASNEWLTKKDFVSVLDVNLLGLIDVTLHMLPFLRKAKGSVVNMSSMLGRLSFIGGGYPISKYGIEAFSNSLRQEMQTLGVHVSVVESGAFSTPIYDPPEESLQRIWHQLAPDIQETMGGSSWKC
ncbi:short-chain dehydrogenase/reductase family 9C member 7-like, partial [Python bivittatus]|uniref:Short-chain dehydrogenase/reductase family 9C member 7-like n=1 Tax=Python bivittatus TaxID=176946 RepID=A0A9F5J5Q2_PYTBI